MENWICGGRRQDGGVCHWKNPPCPHHPDAAAGARKPVPLKLAPSKGKAKVDDMPTPSQPPRALTDAIEARDLYEVAWNLLAESVTAESRNASLISTLIRVLASLGPPPMEEERALKEAALLGLVMNGLAPRTPEEWALAEATFDDDTLADLRQREAIEKRLR